MDEVLAALEAAEVPAGRIYSVADIVEDPHYRAREMILPDPAGRHRRQDAGHRAEAVGDARRRALAGADAGASTPTRCCWASAWPSGGQRLGARGWCDEPADFVRRSARATGCKSSRPGSRPPTRWRWWMVCPSRLQPHRGLLFVSPKAVPALRDAAEVFAGSSAGPARSMSRWCRT